MCYAVELQVVDGEKTTVTGNLKANDIYCFYCIAFSSKTQATQFYNL